MIRTLVAVALGLIATPLMVVFVVTPILDATANPAHPRTIVLGTTAACVTTALGLRYLAYRRSR